MSEEEKNINQEEPVKAKVAEKALERTWDEVKKDISDRKWRGNTKKFNVSKVPIDFNTFTKKKPNDYSDEEKVAVLLALRESGYDFALTAKKTNIRPMIIRSWRKQFGKNFEDLVRDTYFDDVAVLAEHLEEKYKESKEKFVKASHIVKMITLDRILEIIPEERNLRFLNETLKTLQEITETPLEGMKEAKSTNQFLQIVQNQIIQASNGSKKD